jgi:hypothetical protein
VVLEVDLHDLVGKSEHDGMLCSHPFLNIDVTALSMRRRYFWNLGVGLLNSLITLKVRSEMLK